ncbi:ModE family transcriptional regulator [Marinobacterium zhoushanense]|uniref:ModE family transcriptional regulator n=1 Tax=Marinobacterium zhoushanense TaxID=1679163 RepID=A0ABQ1KIE6_9GAMM|nr:TOBE domain-containing protein [Marinobacterium zhoushanense]GGB96830.1 ModE family transcriptional regulator [Marinobacterium zhoushanense]
MAEQNQQLEALAAQLDSRGRLEKRLRLLEAIASTGSLTAAAELTGVSYKTAWNHLRELNSACGETLVSTSTGGASGGGSRLTDSGEALLKLLRIQRTGSRHRLAQRVPALRFSARNQLPARVIGISTSGVIARVDLRIGSLELYSHITRSSIERLGLSQGGGAFAIIKASALELLPPDSPEPVGDINCLPARVLSCESSAQGREIELELAEGVSLTVARAFNLSEEAWIYQGAALQVLIQPEEIMLATAA